MELSGRILNSPVNKTAKQLSDTWNKDLFVKLIPHSEQS